MFEAFVMTLALGYLAFALLACAMGRHRDDIIGRGQPDLDGAAQRRVRVAAGLLLVAALAVAVGWVGAAFGTLLWVLQASLAAMLVAFTLTWRPRLLAPLMRCVAYVLQQAKCQ